MKKTFLPGLALVLTSALHAQFYAPETDFHDISQRCFPVEAARVLAWQHPGAGAGAITEVTYRLEETADHESVWRIEWLGAEHQKLREKTVRYPESLLSEGPKYFREVFRQLCGDDWKSDGTSPGYVAAYWEGAKMAGVSRPDAIAAAGRLIAGRAHLEQADAARLAGLLAHGAMPSTATKLTIDSVLLARAAAWLCIAENPAPSQNDSPWVPILVLAGRDNLAQTVWKQASQRAEPERGDAERYWDFYLQRPLARDCFLFAAQAGNRQFAMPAMIFPHHFDPEWTGVLVSVADEIFGPQVTTRFFEYGPNISVRGEVAGGHWGARMPGLAMGEWLKALRGFQPSALDYQGYREPLKTALSSDATDVLAQFAPLINLGLEGGGPLIPVADVTARDLLGYGWEELGMQFGYTYNFLAHELGDDAAADELAKSCLEKLKGVEVFFQQTKTTPKYPLEDLGRLQFVGSSLFEGDLQKKIPAEWKDQPDIFFRRCWLAFGPNIALETMIRAHASDEDLKSMIGRLRLEGGPSAIGFLVNYDYNTQFPKVIDRLGLRAVLVAELPWSLHSRLEAVNVTYLKKNDPWAYAQALEKLGWESSSFANFEKIFFQYLQANADASAKRFYDEVQPYVTNRVVFSNATGPGRYALAWLEHDEATELRVLKDSDTYSERDLLMVAAHWIIHNDDGQARVTLDACGTRYPTSKGLTDRMKDYLPLVPALLDLHHADHVKALDTFPRDESWLFVRWALAVQAKLPVEEVARLFGGHSDNEEIFVAAVRGDKERFEALYDKRTLRSAMAWVAATHLRSKLTGATPPPLQPDLKPAGARSIQELVHEELQRQRN
jgi:hypothetical protein